jgi:hypothetical protein
MLLVVRQYAELVVVLFESFILSRDILLAEPKVAIVARTRSSTSAATAATLCIR